MKGTHASKAGNIVGHPHPTVFLDLGPPHCGFLSRTKQVRYSWASEGGGMGGLGPWILKFDIFLIKVLPKKVVFLVLSEENEISTVLAPWKNPILASPGKPPLLPMTVLQLHRRKHDFTNITFLCEFAANQRTCGSSSSSFVGSAHKTSTVIATSNVRKAQVWV